jgi:hypothetical protein
MYKKHILLGKFSLDNLNKILSEASEIGDTGKQIEFLSRQFLDVAYAESTLIGDMHLTEVFVINLEGVDCFTFLDYIEAMRLSGSFSEFEDNIKKIRYKSGIVSFENRNHFFTDWREFHSDFVEDVTGEIGSGKTVAIRKMLNMKDDGTYFLPGISPMDQEILYIPSEAIDEPAFDRLRTGDYAGIYSHINGLDVSHVGIIIRDKDNIYLRHASSQKEYRKVVDQDFKKYIANKPGLIILRPKNIDG